MSNDRRVFCFGLNDARYDELLPQCKVCKAQVDNSLPPGYIVVTRKNRCGRLYYAGDAEGHPCFVKQAVDAAVMNYGAAMQEIVRCSVYTGKEFCIEGGMGVME